MVVLNKKRITLVAIAACFSIFAFMFTTAKLDTKETVVLPVSGKTIVLDAGHGIPDERDKMLKLKNKTLQMAIYQRNILVG